jgi:acyl carrier protein
VLRPEMTAETVPEWDSLNLINLVVGIEAEFRIEFQTAEPEAIHNVGTLVVRIKNLSLLCNRPTPANAACFF